MTAGAIRWLSRAVAGATLFAVACSSGDSAARTQSNIKHLVVVVQENHSFDSYFGRYCTAPPGSQPSCNEGPGCCEAGPATDPSGALPVVLDDRANGAFDPDHSHDCMVREINGGKMDGFVVGTCADPRTFAYADSETVAPYRRLAADGSLADRYFQPIAGPSSPNNVYFARAGYAFKDQSIPSSSLAACVSGDRRLEDELTIGDLLDQAGVRWAVYAEGYQRVVDANGDCPEPEPVCPAKTEGYPCNFDPSDIPFAFFSRSRERNLHDFERFASDLDSKSLPSVSFVKAIGYRTEHPGLGTTISAGAAFVTAVIERIEESSHAADTLILVTFDEGGGYFDHVAPPLNARFDEQPYGTRVPTLALGPFARKNWVSHTVMEHSSIVKFIEWNWLGATGQLGTRDREVANIGSLLDPRATGVVVPED